MKTVLQMKSGSLRCGPDLLARKGNNGYELWKATSRSYRRTWVSMGTLGSKDDAKNWLLSWSDDPSAYASDSLVSSVRHRSSL